MENTIIDALNALVTKMGGDAKDNLMIVDALNDIIENYSGGGGGGDSGFTVTFTVNTILNDAEYDSTYDATCDKTAEEVITAISNGEKINVKITSLDYDETQITSYYTVLSNYAYPQEGGYSIATLTNSNKVVGFYPMDDAIVCSVYQYASVPISYLVSTNGGVAKVGYDIFTGEQAFGAYADNKMMTFTIVGKDCRPLSMSYVYNTSIATIDFVIGGVIKRYTLDSNGNFAEVV